MSAGILVAVLGAALLHGTWNAIAKAIPARLVSCDDLEPPGDMDYPHLWQPSTDG